MNRWQEDFEQVEPTAKEITEYVETHEGRNPREDRYRCLICDVRLWGGARGFRGHLRSAKHRKNKGDQHAT